MAETSKDSFAFHADGGEQWFIATLASPAKTISIYIQKRDDAYQERAEELTIFISNNRKERKEFRKALAAQPEHPLGFENSGNGVAHQIRSAFTARLSTSIEAIWRSSESMKICALKSSKLPWFQGQHRRSSDTELARRAMSLGSK